MRGESCHDLRCCEEEVLEAVKEGGRRKGGGTWPTKKREEEGRARLDMAGKQHCQSAVKMGGELVNRLDDHVHLHFASSSTFSPTSPQTA